MTRTMPNQFAIYGLAVREVRLIPLTVDQVEAIEPWFDDAETIRYLGDRGWVHDALRLNELMVSGKWPEPDVVARHLWVAFDDEDPVGLLGVEAYDNKTASLSVV